MKLIPVTNINLGGIADSAYQGMRDSVAESVGLDMHSTPGLITANYALAKDSGSTVDNFVKCMIQCSDGNMYAFDSSAGKIWERNGSTGVWSLKATASPAAGSAGILGAIEYQGYIYYAMQSRLGRWQLGTDWSTRSDSWATFSITDSLYHPMEVISSTLYIGDGNYIAQVDSSGTFTANALDLKSPYRVKCLGKLETDLLIGTYINDNVNKTEILRWNTWSVSWSMDDTIEETGINSIINADNYNIVNAGTAGNLYYYDNYKLNHLKQIPGTYSPTSYGLVHPNAQGNLNGLPLFGFSNGSGNPTSQGVYSFGSKRSGYNRVLNLEFVISEAVLSGIEIGAISVAGHDVFVSWKNGSSYGVDKLDYTLKYNGGYFVSRVVNPSGFVMNSYKKVIVPYTSMPSGCSVSIYTKINNGSWVQQTSVVDASRGFVVTDKGVEEGGDLQVKVVLNTSSGNSPVIKGLLIGVE